MTISDQGPVGTVLRASTLPRLPLRVASKSVLRFRLSHMINIAKGWEMNKHRALPRHIHNHSVFAFGCCVGSVHQIHCRRHICLVLSPVDPRQKLRGLWSQKPLTCNAAAAASFDLKVLRTRCSPSRCSPLSKNRCMRVTKLPKNVAVCGDTSPALRTQSLLLALGPSIRRSWLQRAWFARCGYLAQGVCVSGGAIFLGAHDH